MGFYSLDVKKLAEERRGKGKNPLPHQDQSFARLSKTLPVPISDYKGTLLVLPTGGGKTYTSIHWIVKEIVAKGIKVLWLAQSSYLIEQARKTFFEEIHHANGRDKIHLRIVSGNTTHANAGTIATTDDILICTTQTAIRAYTNNPTDLSGSRTTTPLKKFIHHCKNKSLFVVIDEAHHTPAFGCRTLLLSFREKIKNLYVLGLTATPTHMDQRISGWLNKIYDKGICNEVKTEDLIANGILARPNYIQTETGIEVQVDDTLYELLKNKHKDVPENIIDDLATKNQRNDYIIGTYIKNKKEYGKTIIFADRWYQCEYIVKKLKEKGVKAAAIYSVVDRGQIDPIQGGYGRSRNNEENNQIMEKFKDGELDVVVNVRMLTEGVDVPDVKTVMITRETTSKILLTQMIGRALRGERVGGKKTEANIVFFHDTWARLIPWANVTNDEGDAESRKPEKRKNNLMSLISVQLIRNLTSDIEYKGFHNPSFLTFVPIGFYVCEYTIAISDDLEGNNFQELKSFGENIAVYEFNKNNYITLVEHLKTLVAIEGFSQYAAEDLSDGSLIEKSTELAEKFFDTEKDNFDGMLISNVGNIVRHMAQNTQEPEFIDFSDRSTYDLDKVAEELRQETYDAACDILEKKFANQDLHWKYLYKNIDDLTRAFHQSQRRIRNKDKNNKEKTTEEGIQKNTIDNPLTDFTRRQVRERDQYTCLCCGRRGRGIRLEVDHIKPLAMGGTNDIFNLQILCNRCNAIKGYDREIDYRLNKTPLHQPKPKLTLFDGTKKESIKNTISRIINDFYQCKAIYKINAHERRNGKYYLEWQIDLHLGNNNNWLLEHKQELLDHIKNDLEWSHVEDIIISTSSSQ